MLELVISKLFAKLQCNFSICIDFCTHYGVTRNEYSIFEGLAIIFWKCHLLILAEKLATSLYGTGVSNKTKHLLSFTAMLVFTLWYYTFLIYEQLVVWSLTSCRLITILFLLIFILVFWVITMMLVYFFLSINHRVLRYPYWLLREF